MNFEDFVFIYSAINFESAGIFAIIICMNIEFTNRLEQIESQLDKALSRNAYGTLDSCVNNTHFNQLTEPCERLVKLGGKRWRPLLTVLCAEMTAKALNKDSSLIKNAYSLTPLVEFAHTASLIHDDIEDGADTRRGQPCAHIKYGTDVAINAGSWLYFQASSVIQNTELDFQQKCSLYELFLTELRRLHLGQAMDIMWHRNIELFPTTDEYSAMVKNKTGTLARMAVKLGTLCGGADEATIEKAGRIAEEIGVGFQILDDVTNLTTGNPGKKRGDDIVEGKKSLVVLLHISKNPQDQEILSGLFARAQKEGIDSPAVELAIDFLSKGGAIQEAKEQGLKLVETKTKELAELFGVQNEYSKLIIELFSSMSKK